MTAPAQHVRLLDQAFRGPAWHGPSLWEALRPFDAVSAAWRPAPGRHSAWELALHCAYWKNRVIGRISGQRRPFPRAGVNFPPAPEDPNQRSWAGDLALLEDVHAGLVNAVLALDPADLSLPGPRQKRPREAHVTGTALHDVYHAGQIRLLWKTRP